MTDIGTSPQETSPPDADAVGGPKRKRRWLWALVLALGLLAFDLSRAPDAQLGAKVLLGAIDLYQATLSRAMPSLGVQCRFCPSCSHYGEEAIRRHGAARGSGLAFWRVLRCGPWTPAGTVDPVPARQPEPRQLEQVDGADKQPSGRQ